MGHAAGGQQLRQEQPGGAGAEDQRRAARPRAQRLEPVQRARGRLGDGAFRAVVGDGQALPFAETAAEVRDLVEPDEDEEAPDTDDRSEATGKVLPKQPDEFVCQSCFLVKHPSQLADKKNMLCRDCV